MRKLTLVLMILVCSGFAMAQTIRFDGSNESAEDTANFLIDNKFAVEVEYDDKLETIRLRYSRNVWGKLFKKGTWFAIRNCKLEVLNDSEYLRKNRRNIAFTAANYYWNMKEQRFRLRSTFIKRF